VLFISLLSPPAQVAVSPQPFPVDFQKGVTIESWRKGEYASAASDRTLAEIVQPSGANWLAVVVKCFQNTVTSTDIRCLSDQATATDDDLRHVIRRAHDLGLKVMLKPHIDLLNLSNANSGRFDINFRSDESAWLAWFASYTQFITHYAALAQELNVEYFVVGTELEGTAGRIDQWRAVIQQVRRVYSGPLTYAALTYFEPLQIAWWDDLDAIGIDAYYLVTLSNNPTLTQMRLGWTPIVTYLSWLSSHWNKPIILTEIGYMSVDGANVLPGEWSIQSNTDDQEQAIAYQAVFQAFQGQDWWKGIFWWSLSTEPNQGGPNDQSYSFHNKPAEEILRYYFSSQIPERPFGN
jgi:glycosyl hydrolase family 113